MSMYSINRQREIIDRAAKEFADKISGGSAGPKHVKLWRCVGQNYLNHCGDMGLEQNLKDHFQWLHTPHR